jgi:hypothetical protein
MLGLALAVTLAVSPQRSAPEPRSAVPGLGDTGNGKN